jgi:hypothetical protein
LYRRGKNCLEKWWHWLGLPPSIAVKHLSIRTYDLCY